MALMSYLSSLHYYHTIRHALHWRHMLCENIIYIFTKKNNFKTLEIKIYTITKNI